jgi:hypothetical protein
VTPEGVGALARAVAKLSLSELAEFYRILGQEFGEAAGGTGVREPRRPIPPGTSGNAQVEIHVHTTSEASGREATTSFTRHSLGDVSHGQ